VRKPFLLWVLEMLEHQYSNNPLKTKEVENELRLARAALSAVRLELEQIEQVAILVSNQS
jgi:hypothetical protein